MPPGAAYNWLCVAHSVVDILNRAAQIRAAQLEKTSAPLLGATRGRTTRPRRADTVEDVPPIIKATPLSRDVPQNLAFGPSTPHTKQSQELAILNWRERDALTSTVTPAAAGQAVQPEADAVVEHIQRLAVEDSAQLQEPVMFEALPTAYEVPLAGVSSIPGASADVGTVGPTLAAEAQPVEVEPTPVRKLQSSKVPASRLGRLFHYGGLAASLGYGAASELIRRSTQSSEESSSSLIMTEPNIRRLVSKLTQMRGAALKLGQFMSIQDTHVLPPEVEDIFRRVQDSAHYMPDWQMEEVMVSSIGASWMDNFASFDRIPFAAASIGQVHSAILSRHASPTGREEKVAVKIQFPNIVNSINSDLGYVKVLLTAGRLLPKGLFLDRTIQVMKEELADECDYSREARFLQQFGHPSHLGGDPRFKVPWAWQGSTDRVLVMEYVDGVSVGGKVIEKLSQKDRDDIAERIIELCLKELFEFKAMQTDPNWTNFLWNPKTRQIELVDFGATREYSREFMDHWLHLLQSAADNDREACIDWSMKVGYLTGGENEIMLDAHSRSMMLLATPFRKSTPQPFAFGPGSSWADMTAEIRSHIPAMLQHRLTPPPRETYSLNRKLSGAFLLASRLNARVDSYKLWDSVTRNYKFADSS